MSDIRKFTFVADSECKWMIKTGQTQAVWSGETHMDVYTLILDLIEDGDLVLTGFSYQGVDEMEKVEQVKLMLLEEAAMEAETAAPEKARANKKGGRL